MMPTIELPPIVISEEEYGRLSYIAVASMMAGRRPASGALLADELVRAQLVPASAIPDSVVTMWSTVEFKDEATQQSSVMTLVYPGEEHTDMRLVSVLTPLGAALIGLSQGQSIEWKDPLGDSRKLTVLHVTSATQTDPLNRTLKDEIFFIPKAGGGNKAASGLTRGRRASAK